MTLQQPRSQSFLSILMSCAAHDNITKRGIHGSAISRKKKTFLPKRGVGGQSNRIFLPSFEFFCFTNGVSMNHLKSAQYSGAKGSMRSEKKTQNKLQFAEGSHNFIGIGRIKLLFNQVFMSATWTILRSQFPHDVLKAGEKVNLIQLSCILSQINARSPLVFLRKRKKKGGEGAKSERSLFPSCCCLSLMKDPYQCSRHVNYLNQVFALPTFALRCSAAKEIFLLAIFSPLLVGLSRLDHVLG